MEERKHQVEMRQLARDVVHGVFPSKQIVLDCTPGGGKTASGTILANALLDANVIDSVLWLVPRLSLADQVIDAFGFGVGSRPERRLEIAGPQDNLFPSSLPNMPLTVGHVATYQAVAAPRKGNWRRFRDAVKCHRTLLILDEVQFLNDRDADETAGWHRKVREVYESAAFRLLMSGTLWRTDNLKIPFVEYEKRDGLLYPAFDINYTLRNAVGERAVLPTEWLNRSGVVEYSYKGETHLENMLNDGEDEESRKVRTFLSGDNAVAGLLDGMVEHWRDWCKRVYLSRMLVMADDQTQAKKWRKYLQEKHNVACVLATSKEESAGRKLRHFRERKHGQCLVTVAMAYVGFDCPDLTHLAYLSAARAPSWMLQSFARVSRFDRNAPVDYDHQHAFVFAPDDQRMRDFCVWLRDQQNMGMADRRGRTPPENGKAPLVVESDDFETISATIGGCAAESLSERIDPETTAKLEALKKQCPDAGGTTITGLFGILKTAGVLDAFLNRSKVNGATGS